MSSLETAAPGRRPARKRAVPPTGAPDAAVRAKKIMDWSVRVWFAVAFAGQAIFVFYILALYLRIATGGDPTKWNTVMPHGHVPGETLGNLAAAMHVFLAAAITAAGVMQLVPAVRKRAPAVHRWVGRVYMIVAFTISLGGLYMVWGRGTVGDLSQHLSISLNGLVIMGCAAMAWRYARDRKLGVHRRWALRLFLASSGVWFFRIGFMAWMMVFQRPVGFDMDTFAGPFLTILSFSTYLLPLAVLELYLRAQDRGSAPARIAVASLVGALTLVTALGVFGATVGMWLPRLR